MTDVDMIRFSFYFASEANKIELKPNMGKIQKEKAMETK